MDISTALYVLALILAILAMIPTLRTFFLLNFAVICLAIGLVLDSGAIRV
jgi:hypothetical protein